MPVGWAATVKGSAVLARAHLGTATGRKKDGPSPRPSPNGWERGGREKRDCVAAGGTNKMRPRCSALSLGRSVKTLGPTECARVSKLHFAGAIRDLAQIVPRCEVRRSEDLPNQLQVVDQGKTEPLRRQALHPR